MIPISPYFIAIMAAWMIAQGAKYIIIGIKSRNMRQFRQLYLSGNMPSAHTATCVSLTVLIGCKEGFESSIFWLAVLFSMIVGYDAIMVRRSVGEQGLAIHELIKFVKNDAILPRAAKGHTPLEVIAGGILGIAIGLVVFIATK